MTYLYEIDHEAIDLPGLDVWTRSDESRHAIVVQDERGAIELHAVPGFSVGGIEVHSPRQMYELGPDPTTTNCPVLNGPCWSDGSSLTYHEKFLPLIRSGDSAEVMRMLADWHRAEFDHDHRTISQEATR